MTYVSFSHIHPDARLRLVVWSERAAAYLKSRYTLPQTVLEGT